MAKNFAVAVCTVDNSVHVIVRSMLEATGLAASNLSKQRGVILGRTDVVHTHSTSAAAQAHIDVKLFALEG